MRPAPIPHKHIPKTCTCQWVPVGNGLWERTNTPFPGLPVCRVDHELLALEHMSTKQLRGLARDVGLSSTTRLQKKTELVAAIAKAMRGAADVKQAAQAVERR